MSTVRFSKVLEACGKPDIHLLLVDPAKDKTLQAAIKSDRVMTLYQQSGGTDHGVVGFEQGRSRQFLVFPKPLKPFLGQRIVGNKYDAELARTVRRCLIQKKGTNGQYLPFLRGDRRIDHEQLQRLQRSE